MTYRGRVKNGVVVIEGNASPPEGFQVEISLMAREESMPTLAERYKDIIDILDGLPPDASSNHDHYLYGAPTE